jgi:GNAT superfamily N-acetyltransferase
VDEARYEEAHWDYGRYTRVRFVAEQDGAVVGFGRINHDPDEFHPDKYRLDVVVDPACRRRGIGAALYERLLAELRARGAIAVRAGVPWETEAQGIRFLTHRGFVEVRRGWQSRLDVTRADLARFAGAEVRVVSQGIVLTTLEAAQRRDPDVLQKVYELTMACEQDMPSDDPVTATTSARFLAFAIYAPNALSDAFFLATDAGRYVGLSALYRALAMPGVLHQGLTGVRREYRGKGIATALKVETVRYAQEHGYREIHTWNDERNQPMLHINLALGFVKQPAGVTFEKTL